MQWVGRTSSVTVVSSQSGIVTPEAVVLDFERAGVASRSLAILIDLGALSMAWGILLALAIQIFGSFEGVVGAVVALFSSTALYLVWFAGFETWFQRTPGKAALGLRVVGVDGTPARFHQTFLRAVIGIFEILMALGALAVVVALLSGRDQRLGDMAAGTVVVRQRAPAYPVASARFVPPYGFEGYSSSLDVNGMKERHYELLRRFLLRSHQLAPGARVQVAVALANPLSLALRHNPPPMHPEMFLICVAAAWQRAHEAQNSVARAQPNGAPQQWGTTAGPPPMLSPMGWQSAAPTGAETRPPPPGVTPPPDDLPTLPER